MDNINPSPLYGMPTCPNCAGIASGDMGTASPTLEDIAGYNRMTPQQQQLQKQKLQQAGNSTFNGVPWQPATSATQSQIAPITPTTQPMPITAESLQYLNGFLRTQIGRPVKVDFLIGTNTLVDKSGVLLGVGANFILINEAETDDVVACDFYNIKFIKFYY